MRSLVEALDYTPADPNPVQQAVQKVASSKPGAWVLSKTLAPLDRWLLRLTKGKSTFAGITAAVPVITLTTTGAKSGQPRATPLTGVPIDGSLAVVGTNYGQTKPPAWTFNLAAHPDASVEYRGRSAPVRARPATDDEYERVFTRATAMYPGYADYRKRVTERPIRIFILELAA